MPNLLVLRIEVCATSPCGKDSVALKGPGISHGKIILVQSL